MRSLHEITQIWLCRVLFVVAGVVPTLAVLAWAGVVQTSWHRSMYERQAADLLDADVTFASIKFPRPGVTRIENLVLGNRQTGEQLANIASLELTQTQAGWSIGGDEVRVNRSSSIQLSQWIVELLRRKDELAGDKIHMTLEHVQFKSNTDSAKTFRIVCDRAPTDNGARLNVSVAPMNDEPSRVDLSLLYNREDREASVRLVLDCERSAIACAWLDSTASLLGEDSSFRGKLWARLPSHSHAWLFDGLAGEFTDIDLSRLTALFGDGRIEAIARANIRGAIFKNGHLVKIAGDIDARSGTISNDLAERVTKHLALKSTFAAQPASSQTQFNRLAFAFALDAEGLLIEGRAADATAVLISARGTLASQPACNAVPLAEVARAFTRADAPLVPFGSATPWLSLLMPATTPKR